MEDNRIPSWSSIVLSGDSLGGWVREVGRGNGQRGGEEGPLRVKVPGLLRCVRARRDAHPSLPSLDANLDGGLSLANLGMGYKLRGGAVVEQFFPITLVPGSLVI